MKEYIGMKQQSVTGLESVAQHTEGSGSNLPPLVGRIVCLPLSGKNQGITLSQPEKVTDIGEVVQNWERLIL